MASPDAPWRVRQSSAPVSSPSTISSLKRLAMTPKRRPSAFRSPSKERGIAGADYIDQRRRERTHDRQKQNRPAVREDHVPRRVDPAEQAHTRVVHQTGAEAVERAGDGGAGGEGAGG